MRGAVGGNRQAKLDPKKEKTTQGVESSEISFPVVRCNNLSFAVIGILSWL